MARTLNQIRVHIRAVAENPAISTTLIQTEDLLALCDASEFKERWDEVAALVEHVDGINDERDSVPLLLKVRRAFSSQK